MVLCDIMNERERWQEETFERIKRRLVSYSDDPQFQNAGNHPIVTVYSEPQIGKTTLILTMLGLKENRFQEVYDTLRGGVQKGNSSTATATIYRKSENNNYGFSQTSIEDVDSFDQNIEYCEEKDVRQKIKEIRERVEKNQADEGVIQHIYIPADCFEDEEDIETFSIIDMPGVGSRNGKENPHVKKLVSKYIPIASVCIMAYNAMQFASMGSEILPEHVNWKMRDDKFIIITTKSYIAATTKSYFKQDRSQRTEDFYDHITRETDHLFKNGKFLSENSKMAIYPLDMGESFNNLCKSELENKQDVDEVIQVRKRLIQELRKSISSHKGNKLQSAINELKESVSQYGKKEEEDITKQINQVKDEIEGNEKVIEKKEKYLPSLEEDEGCNADDPGVDELQDKIKRIEISGLKTECEIFWEEIGGNSTTKSYVKIKRKDVEAQKKTLITNLNEIAVNQVNMITKIIRELEENEELRKYDFEDRIKNKREDLLCEIQTEVEAIFKQSIFKEIFGGKLKVNVSQVEYMAERLERDLQINWKMFKDDLSKAIGKIRQQKEEDIRGHGDLVKKVKRKKESLEKENKQKKIQKEQLEEKLEELRSIRKTNTKTVEMYKETARKTFQEYRDEIINKINNPQVNADEKMSYLIFLGILDKDYSMIIGGIGDE